MSKVATDFVFDIEDDLRAARDLSHAVSIVLGNGSASEQDVASALCCIQHLQDHVRSMHSAWTVAVAAEQELAILRPAA